MSDTIRERILQAIAQRTGAVRRLESFDEKDMPFTVLLAGDDAEERVDYDTTDLAMPVTVARALAPAGDKGDAWLTTAENAYGQLVLDVFGSDRSFGDLATRLQHTGGSAGLIEDGTRGITAQAEFLIHYRIATGNPFITEPPLDPDPPPED